MKLTHIFAVSVFGFSLSVGAAGADELGGRYVDILQTETKVASLLPQTNPVPGSSLSGEQDNAQRRGRHQRSAHAASAAPAELKQIVAEQAAANGVPFALAHAVVMVESRYNPRVSNGGALGLMQIKPATARGAASGLYDPATNIRFGMRYLADAYRQAGGDICGTVMRYQSGLYTRSMSGANRAYCGKARQFMAQA
jgi:soluble lytic murein transglycosylase-like protein